jgi:hypothetical protein
MSHRGHDEQRTHPSADQPHPGARDVARLALLIAALPRHDQPRARSALWLLVALGLATLAVFLTGEPAEEAVEDLPGVAESLIELHEEAALAATIAVGLVATFALGVLAWFRRRPLPRWPILVATAATLAVSGMMAWTANLGGMIRHTEIRSGAVTTVDRERSAGNESRGEGRDDERRGQ